MEKRIQETIGNFLDSYGWKYKEVDSDFILSFQGNISSSDYTMKIRSNNNWINITAYILLFFNEKNDLLTVYQKICELNYNELIFARLAYSPKTGMTICADLPTKLIAESVFHDLLDIISFYSDKYYRIFTQLTIDSSNLQGDT